MPDYNTYYKKFLTALGLNEMVEDERYFPVQNLHENNLGTEVYDRVMAKFEEKAYKEWSEILTEADIPFALAKSWEELLEDEQAWANDCFYKMKYPNAERILVKHPVKYQEMGPTPYNRGPFIGEHGEEILKEIGYLLYHMFCCKCLY